MSVVYTPPASPRETPTAPGAPTKQARVTQAQRDCVNEIFAHFANNEDLKLFVQGQFKSSMFNDQMDATERTQAIVTALFEGQMHPNDETPPVVLLMAMFENKDELISENVIRRLKRCIEEHFLGDKVHSELRWVNDWLLPKLTYIVSLYESDVRRHAPRVGRTLWEASGESDYKFEEKRLQFSIFK